MQVPEKCVPAFKPGQPLLAHLNGAPRYNLADLIAECEPGKPVPVDHDWDRMPAVGLERI